MYVGSQLILEALFMFFRHEKVFNSNQEEEFIICVKIDESNLSLAITLCHQVTSLVVPNSHPRDRGFYHTRFL